MKHLKFLLVIFCVSFCALSRVEADTICTYKTTLFHLPVEMQCELTNGTATCNLTKGTSNFSMTKRNLLGVKDCDDTLYFNATTSTPETTFYITSLSRTNQGEVQTPFKFNLTNKETVSNEGEKPVEDNKPEIGGTTAGGESSTNKKDWDPNAFCNRNEVKGAFRVVGWVLVIIKIVVPILLIIFGSIDFGKAVVASKDDEIKKAMKTLVIRAIAGIIIFFVPTILNFVITLIGGEDIYNQNTSKGGSFGMCTYCMLNPSDNTCGKMIGGAK